MSSCTAIDMTGHACVARPLERHEYQDGADGYRCKSCGRPRALHLGRDQPTIPSNMDPRTKPMRTQRFSTATVGKRLTDKKIAEYESRGFYSLEFQAARRALWAQRSSLRRKVNTGNFDTLDGRLIYRP